MSDSFTQLAPAAADAPTADFAARLRARLDEVETGGAAPADWHLAQLNLGLFKAPLDDPEMAPFVAGLDRINELAEMSPGFVWRLKDEDGNSSSFVDVPGAIDPLTASNLTVWQDLESLWNFIYKTDHVSYLRRRAEWFRHSDQPLTVAWWTPAGTLPTLAEACDRLEHFRAHGASDIGFALGRTIPDPPSFEV